MTVNLDRFSCGYTPRPAIEVGDCQACDDMMYDYEQTKCLFCDQKIHQKCSSHCDKCGREGCKGEFGCLKEIDGLLYCLTCLENYHEYKNAA